MPKLVPQHLKTLSTINNQPQHFTNKTLNIMLLDLAGKGNGDIAEMIGMTPEHVSTIRNSPLYKDRLEVERVKLVEVFRDKASDKAISGDPVENAIRDACLDAANRKIQLMDESDSDFVKNTAASDILGIGGYMRKTTKTTTIIEVDQKMADRFERVLSDGHSSDERKHTVRVETEMSE